MGPTLFILSMFLEPTSSVRVTRANAFSARNKLAEDAPGHGSHAIVPVTSEKILSEVAAVHHDELLWVVFQMSQGQRRSDIVTSLRKEGPPSSTFESFRDELLQCKQVVCIGIIKFTWDYESMGLSYKDQQKMFMVMYYDYATMHDVMTAAAVMGGGDIGPWPTFRQLVQDRYFVSVMEALSKDSLTAAEVVKRVSLDHYKGGRWDSSGKALLAQLEGRSLGQRQDAIADEVEETADDDTDEDQLVTEFTNLYEDSTAWCVFDAGLKLILRRRRVEQPPSTFKAFLNELATCRVRVCFGAYKFKWTYTSEIGREANGERMLFVRYIDMSAVPRKLKMQVLVPTSVAPRFQKAVERFERIQQLTGKTATVAVEDLNEWSLEEFAKTVDPKHFTGGIWSPAGKALATMIDEEPGALLYHLRTTTSTTTTTTTTTTTLGTGPFLGFLIHAKRSDHKNVLVFRWSQTMIEDVLAIVTPAPGLPAWEFQSEEELTDFVGDDMQFLQGWESFFRIAQRKSSSVSVLSPRVKVFLINEQGKISRVELEKSFDLSDFSALAVVDPRSNLYYGLQSDGINTFRGRINGGGGVSVDLAKWADGIRTRSLSPTLEPVWEGFANPWTLPLTHENVPDGYLGYLYESTGRHEGTLSFEWSKAPIVGALACIQPESVREWEVNAVAKKPCLTKHGEDPFLGWKQFLKIAKNKGTVMTILQPTVKLIVMDAKHLLHEAAVGIPVTISLLSVAAIMPSQDDAFDGVHRMRVDAFRLKANRRGAEYQFFE